MKTITEFEYWHKKAQINEDEQLPFVWELMRSTYTEYHYSLIINKDTSDKFRSNLWHRFDEHREYYQMILDRLSNGGKIKEEHRLLFVQGKCKNGGQYPDLFNKIIPL
jgi:hypothetical protein